MLRFDLKSLLADYESLTGLKMSYEELSRMTSLSLDTIKSITSRKNYNATFQVVEKISLSLNADPTYYFIWDNNQNKLPLKSEDNTLMILTGLTPIELAKTLYENPRSYMAIRGAVSEYHLGSYLNDLLKRGDLIDLRTGNNDSEKDFYIKTSHGEFIIECKNVEVIKITTATKLREYFKFLIASKNISEKELIQFNTHKVKSLKEIKDSSLKNLLYGLPQKLRESSIPRYQFSSDYAGIAEKNLTENFKDYLKSFEKDPMSIDFRKTRHSNEVKDKNIKENRYYKIGEIDVIAACLFTRTLKWEFIFCATKNLLKNNQFQDRYSNKIIIQSDDWTSNILDCL